MESLSTIIRWAEKKKKPADQAQVLKDHTSGPLKDIIGYAIDPGVTWLLPETDPPYTALASRTDTEGRLYTETRRFIYFVDSPEGRALTPIKREQLFIQLLESIDPKDAALVLRVKNKKLTISKAAAKMAFPNLAKDW
jgi:hypothetical protein